MSALARYAGAGDALWQTGGVTRALLAHGELVVVETDDNLYLGTAEVTPTGIVVRSGYRGHPVTLAADDIVAISRATDHEAVS